MQKLGARSSVVSTNHACREQPLNRPDSRSKSVVEFSQAERHRFSNEPADDIKVEASLLFEELAAAAGQAIISVNDEGTIIECNSAVTGILGFEKQELIGQPISVLIPDRYVAKHERAFKHALREPSFQTRKHEPVSAMTKDGDEIPVEIAMGRWRSGSQVYFTATVIDDRARRRLERDLDQKRIQGFRQQIVTSTFLNILEILSGIHDFDAVLARLLPILNKLPIANICFAYRFADDTGTWLPWGHAGLTDRLAAQFFAAELPELRLPEKLCTGEDPYWSLEGEEFEKNLPPEVAAIARTTKMTNAVVIPVVCGTKPRVVIFILSRAAADISTHEPEILQSLRRHLEAAIYSSLHEQGDLQDQLELAALRFEVDIVRDLARIALTAGSQNKAALHVARKTAAAFGAEIVAVFSFNANANELRLVGSGGPQHAEIDWLDSYDKREVRATAGSLDGNPLLLTAPAVTTAEQTLETAFFDNGCRLVCETPLIFQGNLAGLLVIGFHRSVIGNHALLSTIKRISDQTALVLGNHGLVEKHRELIVGAAESLTLALDAKSPWTSGHSQRTSTIAIKIGKRLFLSEEQLFKLRLAALFHDVGKIGTYDKILDQPHQLDSHDKALIRRHPVKTFEIVSAVPDLREVAEIARGHHERWDGGGYPDGLAGPTIPFLSRIICLADSIDAMCSDRPYRQGLDKDQIKGQLRKGANLQFDPALVTVTLEILDSIIPDPDRSDGDD